MDAETRILVVDDETNLAELVATAPNEVYSWDIERHEAP